ncbi:regucalcin-like [Athalia rosae]|uniref:regucalcin-like n=1 Tax=Athalia rosae TaxID=37344 RepID=UPI0020336DF8|nr:regucalcin-like [Athalia rosae]
MIMRGFLPLLYILGYSWCYQVERITEPLLLGEGPHWNALTQLLYFVDITSCTINVYDPATGVHNSTHIDGGAVTFIVPIAGTTDEFLVSTGLDIRHVIWDGQQDSIPKSAIIYSALQDSDGSRFNDGKVDRTGRLWAGTMGPEPIPNVITERSGKLYQVSQHSSISTELENILISNGLAWSADGSIMYYTDTGDSTIDSFDFDATADHPLSNRQRIFNFTENGVTGNTDGFAIDTDGNLWLASYGSYQVIAVNPKTRTLLLTIPINASQVTSVAWGGSELNELYVTTARKGITEEELKNYPDSGATYRITGLGARGYAGDNYIMYKASSYSNSCYLSKFLISVYMIIIFKLGYS